MTSLRDYQSACKDAVLSAWGESPWHQGGDTFRSVLANLTTSAGKTVIAGSIIKEVMGRGRCLFVADTDELCAQPRKTFFYLFGIACAVDKAGERASLSADVVIGSAQTLTRKERMLRYDPAHFQYIFVDEAHRGSPRNKEIYDYFPAAKVMGMTATAFRSKLADLSDFYDTVAFEMGLFDLIDEGYITPLKILTLPVEVNIRDVKQKMSSEGMDYDKEELDTKIRPYYEAIGRMIIEHAPNRRIVVYLPLIRSSIEFVKVIKPMGISAVHIDGKSPNREAILDQFARGEIQVLSNSSLLTTGWDCPPCDCLLNLAPTRSAGLFRQKVGRIGRVLPNVIEGSKAGEKFILTDKDERKAAIAASAKPNALILDLLWQTEKFGLMGPSDLIAANADERLAIQMKIANLKSAEDLQKIALAVQAEREAALKKALIEAAKRQRAMFMIKGSLVDPVMMATMLHGRAFLNYEPVANWHRRPVSEDQKKFLGKFRVNAKLLKDKGQASALLDLLIDRLKKGLAPFGAVEALEERGIADAAGFTDVQAYNLLGGNYPMPFSVKYHGVPLRNVPASFWRWCKQQPWVEKKWPIVWNWMTSVLDPDAPTLEEAQCQCIGSHQAPNCPVHPRLSEMVSAAVKNPDEQLTIDDLFG